MAVLAAVYAVGSILPGFPMLGVSGAEIELVRSLEIGYGFILGPILGPLTAFIGAIIGKWMEGGGGIYFTPLALVSAFMAAAMSKRSILGVKGWMVASTLLATLILGWYATDTGRSVPQYPVFHVFSLCIILIFRTRLVELLESKNNTELSLGVALCSYPSTMAGHMLGNLIWIILYKPNPLLFMSILPISTIERIVITIISMVITTPLLVIVRNLYPELIEDLLNKKVE